MTRFAMALVVAMVGFAGAIGTAHAVPAVGRPRLVILPPNADRPSPFLAARGLPALRSDGRMVAAFQQLNDWGDGDLLLIDTTTGEVAQRIDWPQESVGDDGQMGPIDRPAMRRIQRMLRTGGYRSLGGLAMMERRNDDEGAASRFETPTGDLTVSYRVSWSDNVPKIEIASAGRTIAFELDEQAELGRVAVSPAADFVILEEMFCACHCSTTPTLRRLP